MPEIQLEKDNVKLIFDEEEYEIAKNYKWHIKSERKGTSYCIATRIKKQRYSISQIVFTVPKGNMIYHKNGNLFDFRKSQIAIVTRQEYFHLNNSNCGKTSKYARVFYDKNGKYPWHVRIEKDKIYFGGRYETEEEAAIASDYLAIKLYKHKAERNFPELTTRELLIKYQELQVKYGKSMGEKLSKSNQGVPFKKCGRKSSSYVSFLRYPGAFLS